MTGHFFLNGIVRNHWERANGIFGGWETQGQYCSQNPKWNHDASLNLDGERILFICLDQPCEEVYGLLRKTKLYTRLGVPSDSAVEHWIRGEFDL